MLHITKTVIGSDFDQETAEKIAPPFIPRLELANCRSDLLCEMSTNIFNRVKTPCCDKISHLVTTMVDGLFVNFVTLKYTFGTT